MGYLIRYNSSYQPWCVPKVVYFINNEVYQKWLTLWVIVYTISDITLLKYLNLSTLKLMLSYH